MSRSKRESPWLLFLTLTVVFALIHAAIVGALIIFGVATQIFDITPPPPAEAVRATGPLLTALVLPFWLLATIGFPSGWGAIVLNSLCYGAIPAALIAWLWRGGPSPRGGVPPEQP